MMDGREPLDRLDFNDNRVCDDEVEPMVAQQLASIHDGNLLFSFEGNSSRMELDANSAEAGAFQQTRSQPSMHRDTAADCPVDQGLDFIR
jgi:hypothetical protein